MFLVVENVDIDVLKILFLWFLNCEFFWLCFNMWVIEEVENLVLFVFECLCFLLIFVSNFDEFYMVCVVGLCVLVCNGVIKLSIDGLILAEQIEQIYVLVSELMGKQ